MRKFIVLAACCIVGGVCSSTALARPLVSYNNNRFGATHFKDGTSSKPALLAVNAEQGDDCSVQGTDVVTLRIGQYLPSRMYPCQGSATEFNHGDYRVMSVDYSFLDPHQGAWLQIYSFAIDNGGHWPLTVSYRGRALFKGVLHAKNTYVPVRRVYQGTDGFTNICIDQNRKVYSYHLKLYCNVGGTGTSVTTITSGR